jgi:hypothetical protein
MRVRRVPEIPNPRRAVLMTKEPKLDQFPTENVFMTKSSKAMRVRDSRNKAKRVFLGATTCFLLHKSRY